MASSPLSYFQGAFTATVAATIRVTYDPGGVPATSDFSIAVGDYYASADAFCAAWQAQVEADIGGVGWSISVVASGGLGYVTLVTPGLDVSVTWSQAGDGTVVRDWLGEAADLVAVSTGYEFGNSVVGWYPERPFQVYERTSSSRLRMQMTVLSGTSRTQHTTAVGDLDDQEYDLEVWFGPTDAHAEMGRLSLLLDDIDTYSGDGSFSVYYSDGSGVFCFVDETVRIEMSQVIDGFDDLWRTRLRLRVLSGEA